ncbi:hypothetical protein ODI_R1917 [Orrella dioscoreae]|uniref:Uncharacterized protein n=2 Tax=root TaxID=1 RepID=A0A1C3K8L9_9BURK|nr:hypothetical protein ODI_02161 [Orrella dioscoreae]SOE49208.1 hypothetical protein ODI_R1917 [Orrella dioscoreae]
MLEFRAGCDGLTHDEHFRKAGDGHGAARVQRTRARLAAAHVAPPS